MRVGSLVKWWTTNKTDINSHFGNNHFFQIVHSIKHSMCGSSFPCNAKLKKDDDFTGLIWISKVCYARALKMFGRAKIGQDLHPKGKWKGDCLIYELAWIEDDSWLVSSITFNFHFKFALCFKHVFFKLYSLVCVYVHLKIQGTTKKAFVVNLMKIILTNWQLYMWQYVQFTQTTVAHYHSANGLSVKFIIKNSNEIESESN